MRDVVSMGYVIWKYKLSNVAGSIELSLPRGAQILRVGTQGAHPYVDAFIWVAVVPGNESEKRRFRFVPTGMPFPEGWFWYVGTIEVEGGLLFHLFEEVERMP